MSHTGTCSMDQALNLNLRIQEIGFPWAPQSERIPILPESQDRSLGGPDSTLFSH